MVDNHWKFSSKIRQDVQRLAAMGMRITPQSTPQKAHPEYLRVECRNTLTSNTSRFYGVFMAFTAHGVTLCADVLKKWLGPDGLEGTRELQISSFKT